MLLNQFNAFSINLNAQPVNGLTHFDRLKSCPVIRYFGSRISKYFSINNIRCMVHLC